MGWRCSVAILLARYPRAGTPQRRLSLNTASPQAVGLLALAPLSPCGQYYDPRRNVSLTASIGFAADVDAEYGSMLTNTDTAAYVSMGDVDTPVGGVTITARVRQGEISGGAGTHFVIAAKRDGGTNVTSFGFDAQKDTGTLRFYINSGGFCIWQTSAAVLTTSATRTVGVSYDEVNNAVFYADGRVVASSRTSGTVPRALLNNDLDLRIGKFANASASDQSWVGRISDVRIYAGAKSAGFHASVYDPVTRWDLYRTTNVYAPIFSKARFDDSHQTIGGPM